MCTLLFGGEGAIGLLLASLLIAHADFGRMDAITTLGAVSISAGAPYLVYRLALYSGMPATLRDLTPAKLSILALVYAFSSSFMHALWYALRGIYPRFLNGFTAMFIGDLLGTLIVAYAIKAVLTISDRRSSQSS